MDDDGLNMRNWGYYEQSPLKEHLGFQLGSPLAEQDKKSFLFGHDNVVMVPPNGVFRPRDYAFTEPPVTHMDYVRDSWINHRDKFLHMFPGKMYNSVHAEPSETHNSMMLNKKDKTKETEVSIEESSVKNDYGRGKKRSVAVSMKLPKVKKSKKGPYVHKENGNSSVHHAKAGKKIMDVVTNGIDMDISGIAIPVCSCTGTPRQCYRWGCGGWQSACCTTTISMYPLPMSTKRRGARIAGRKMSRGAFKKVLEKLGAEGYDFTNPIDLKTFWAKHGTNKFVTIR